MKNTQSTFRSRISSLAPIAAFMALAGGLGGLGGLSLRSLSKLMPPAQGYRVRRPVPLKDMNIFQLRRHARRGNEQEAQWELGRRLARGRGFQKRPKFVKPEKPIGSLAEVMAGQVIKSAYDRAAC